MAFFLVFLGLWLGVFILGAILETLAVHYGRN